MSAKDLYLVSDERRRYVKIGRSDNVQARLAQIQALTPHPIHLVAVFEGLGWMEQTLHRAFEVLREHNEWFVRSEVVDGTERVGVIDHFIRITREYRRVGVRLGDTAVLMALAQAYCEFDGTCSEKLAASASLLLRTAGAAYLEQADAIEATLRQPGPEVHRV